MFVYIYIYIYIFTPAQFICFRPFLISTLELGYNVVKGTEYFVSSKTSVVITEQNNVMVNSEELIGTTIYDAIKEMSLKPMSL
jgi:hypothetical protein